MATALASIDEIAAKSIEALKRRTEADRAARVAAARGRGISTGTQNSSFESRSMFDANRQADEAQATGELDINREAANQRLTVEEAEKSRNFQAESQRLQNDFIALENAKNQAFQTGQLELAQQFEAQQNEIQRQFQAAQLDAQRASDAMNARREGRADLLNTGAQIGTMALLSKGAGLFGSGAASAPAATSALNLVPGGLGSTLGSGAAGAGGIGMGTLGLGALGMGLGAALGSGTGQVLGKSIFKSDSATTGSRKGSQLGGILGATGVIPGGGLVGGTIGSVLGGLSKKVFCFLPETLIEMLDGSGKHIDDLKLGEVTKGGIVDSIRYAYSEDLYDYEGVKVTGKHAVLEDGVWLRLEDSKRSKRIPGRWKIVSIVTSYHRVYSSGITFADEHESDLYEHLDLNESLALLNTEEKRMVYA